MKNANLIVLFIIILSSCVNGQGNYVLAKASFELPEELQGIMDEHMGNISQELLVVFFYGYEFNKLLIFSFTDPFKANEIQVKKEKGLITKQQIKFPNDSVYQYLNQIDGEFYMLISENRSIHPDGYIYLVFRKGKLSASFYSSMNIENYELSVQDREQLQTLYLLLDILEIEM